MKTYQNELSCIHHVDIRDLSKHALQEARQIREEIGGRGRGCMAVYKYRS